MTDEKKSPKLLDETDVPKRIIGSDEAPRLYSDSVEVKSSLFDFRLHVRVTLDKTKEEVSYRHLCTIHLSPPHFKKLVEVLNNQLEGYESLFGEIPTGVREDSGEPESH